MSKPVLTLEAFAEFCASKPADEQYDYWSYENCACGQYAASIGVSDWKRAFNRQVKEARGFWWDANYAAVHSNTFGGLVEHLRASRLRAVSQP